MACDQMSLRIVLDGKFFWYQGHAYSGHMHYDLFARKYIDAGVTELIVCGRAYETAVLPAGARRLDGPGVRFERLAQYKGASQFLASISKVIGRCWSLARAPEQIMLYVPGTLPFVVLFFCSCSENLLDAWSWLILQTKWGLKRFAILCSRMFVDCT